MFGFRRQSQNLPAIDLPAKFQADLELSGPFEALKMLLAALEPGSDFGWVFAEIMRNFPDPFTDSAELHLLMGMYLLKTGAVAAAEIEFQKSGEAFVAANLPAATATFREFFKPSTTSTHAGLNQLDYSEQDFEIQLNEAIEFWALEKVLQNRFGKNLPKQHLVSGLLTHRNFPETSAIVPRFVAISIADERLLTPARLSVLQKSAPIAVRDQATSTLLDYFEVPNFVIGPASALVEVGQVKPSETATAWIAINQWAEAAVQRYSAEDFFERGQFKPKKLLGALQHQEIRTSIPAIAQLGLRLERKIEFKPKPKFRPFVSSYPDNRAAQQLTQANYTRWLDAIASQKDLATVFGAELTSTTTRLGNQFDHRKSSVSNSVVERLRANVVRLQQVEPAERHLHLAFGFDRNLLQYFEPVMDQIANHASFSADIHILGRGFASTELAALPAKYPHFGFHFYAFDEVDYGPGINTLEHITVSTLDRLLLPELLPNVNQVLYLDTDLMVFEDLWEIGKIKLQQQAMAARPITTEIWGSAYKTFHKAAAKLEPNYVDELRKLLLFEYRMLSTQMINAGVVLLNLKLMRQENFLDRYLPLVESARFNDQDVLSLWAAGRIHRLGTEWNWTIAQTEIVRPKIVHWAGPRKPWRAEFVWLQTEFQKSLASCATASNLETN